MTDKERKISIMVSAFSVVLGLTSVAIGVISLLKKSGTADTASQCNIIPIGSLALLRRD